MTLVMRTMEPEKIKKKHRILDIKPICYVFVNAGFENFFKKF